MKSRAQRLLRRPSEVVPDDRSGGDKGSDAGPLLVADAVTVDMEANFALMMGTAIVFAVAVLVFTV